VSLEEGILSLSKGDITGSGPVAITFDDGFRDFYTAAWPVLWHCGFTATMYLPTASISQNGGTFRGKQCLTWGEVRELRRHGIRFGSHTVTHPKLNRIPLEQIESELTLSKQTLEDELGEKIVSFAYPYAFPQEDRSFVGRLAKLLHNRGYRTCVTTVVGRSQIKDSALFLKRLPVNSGDDREFFQAKLEGAYDWVGSAQYAHRKVAWLTTVVCRYGSTRDRETQTTFE
jgi:peptidoglycan/xylan/chitin deacetylase (PgdA/CDA1 family)